MVDLVIGDGWYSICYLSIGRYLTLSKINPDMEADIKAVNKEEKEMWCARMIQDIMTAAKRHWRDYETFFTACLEKCMDTRILEPRVYS